MTQALPAPAPAAAPVPKPRIYGLDIARGLAVIGMVIAHTMDATGVLHIVNGRSAALFGLLAGISIALMTGRTQVPAGPRLAHDRLKLIGRGIMIFAIGLVLELLGTSVAVILTFYGMVYIVATLFIGVRKKLVLLAWALGIALIGPPVTQMLAALPLSGGFGYGVTLLDGVYSLNAWVPLMLFGLILGRMDISKASTAKIAAGIGAGAMVIGYSLSFGWVALAGVLDIDTDKVGGFFSWTAPVSAAEDVSGDISEDSLASMVVTGDDEFIEGKPAEEFDFSGLVCDSFGEGFIDCYPPDTYGDMDDMGADRSPLMVAIDVLLAGANGFFIADPHSGGTMEIIGSGGFAALVVGLMLLGEKYLRRILYPLIALGSMPLTAYSAHVVAIWGLQVATVSVQGDYGMYQDTVWFGPALILALLIGCTLWYRTKGRGPLEKLTGRVATRYAEPPVTSPEAE